MKKILILMIAMLVSLSGCFSNDTDKNEKEKTDKENAFNVTETFMDLYENKTVTVTNERHIVVENGEAKIDRGHVNTNIDIANAYQVIGMMYADGKGKTLDLNLAESNLKKSLQYDSKNGYSYLNLGYVSYKKNQFDDALTYYDQALTYLNPTDKEGISLVLSNKAAIYLDTNDLAQEGLTSIS